MWNTTYILVWGGAIGKGIDFHECLFQTTGVRSHIHFSQNRYKVGYTFRKIGLRNGYVLKLGWHVPDQTLDKCTPPPPWARNRQRERVLAEPLKEVSKINYWLVYTQNKEDTQTRHCPFAYPWLLMYDKH